jgi:hypothetical protein
MKGFYDLLIQKPSSLFILLGCSYLNHLHDDLGLVERMAVWCKWTWCPNLILCSAMADLSKFLGWHVAGAPSIWCQSSDLSTQWRPYTPGVFGSRSFLTDHRELHIFLGGWPMDLMLNHCMLFCRLPHLPLHNCKFTPPPNTSVP